MRVAALAILLVLLSAAGEAAAAGPNPRAPILVAQGVRGKGIDAVLLKRSGDVLRRMRLPCQERPHFRDRSGMLLLCPGIGASVGQWWLVNLRTGKRRVVWSSDSTFEGPPSLSPDGKRLVVGVHEVPPGQFQGRSYVLVIDLDTGARNIVFEEAPCSSGGFYAVPDCTGSANNVPRLETRWTYDSRHVHLLRERTSEPFWLLDVASGELTPNGGNEPAPTEPLLARLTLRPPLKLYGFDGSVAEELPFASGIGGEINWSPNGRYISDAAGRIFDRKRGKIVDRVPFSAWGPDSRTLVLLDGKKVRLQPVGGKAGKPIFTVSRTKSVLVHWVRPAWGAGMG
jgi:hypothetical protein